MVKQWFGFSELVLAGAVSLATAGIIQITSLPSFADDGVPTPVASAAPINYPVVDLIAKISGTAKIGDQISVQLSANGISNDLGPDLSLNPPESQTEAVVDQGWSVGPGLMISPLKVGQLTLPALEIKNKAGQIVARTNPLNLEVASSISPKDPKPQEPVELKPPVGVPVPLYLRITFILVILCVLGLLGYWMRRWYKTRKIRPGLVLPPRPLDERTLSELETLFAKNHLSRGEHKIHYFKLSEIIKKYLGERYNFDASESTTYELLEKLRSEKSLDQIQSFFDSVDRVKFTDYVPSEEEGKKQNQEAREVVSRTAALSTNTFGNEVSP